MRKDFFREIKETKGRFFAIMALVGLGILVFVGLSVSGPIMRNTLNNTLEQGNMADLRLSMPYGLEDRDLKLIEEIDYKDKEFGYDVDLVSKRDNKNFNIADLPEKYGTPILVEGRLPEKSNEILLDEDVKGEDYDIGKTINFKIEKDLVKDELPALKRYNFKIVGFAKSPYYISRLYKGTTTKGGQLFGFGFVLPEVFDGDYTYADFTFSDLEGLKFTEEEYDDRVMAHYDKIDELFKNRPQVRLDEMREDFQEELDDGEEEIKDAKEEIYEAKADLEEAKADLDKAEKEYEDAVQKLRDGLASGELTLQEASAKLREAKAELNKNQKKLDDAIADIAEGYKTIAKNEKDLKEGKESYRDGLKEYEEGIVDYEEGRDKLKDAEEEFASGSSELASEEKKLEDTKKEVDTKLEELEDIDIPDLQFSDLSSLQGTLQKLKSAKKMAMGQLSMLQSKLPPSHPIKVEDPEVVSQIGAVQGKITSKKGEVSSLQGQVASLEGQEDKEAELQAAKSKLATAQSELSSLQSELANLEAKRYTYIEPDPPDPRVLAQIAQLKGKIAVIDSNIPKVQNGIAKMRRGLNQIEELEDAKSDLKKAQDEIDEGFDTIGSEKEKLKDAEEELKDARKEVTDAESDLTTAKKELRDSKQEIQDGEVKISDAKVEIKDAEDEVADGKIKLQDGKKEYQDGLADYNKGRQELEDKRREGESKLADARSEIDEGQEEYEEGLEEYEEETPKAWEDIADAEEDLDLGRERLKILKKPSYSITPTSREGSIFMHIDFSQRVDNLASIFPVFFFFIAMLLASTTMNRLVDEQRTQIGTYKSLGYSNFDIAWKYIGYGGIAALIGSVIGILIGNYYLSKIIAEAYSTGYIFDGMLIEFYPKHALFALAIGLVSTSVVAYLSVRQSLKLNAATLLRPKAPPKGTRILLERIEPIWNRLNFLQKVTARNIFRYKKRMLMTIFGVIGATALLLFGFGIDRSVYGLAEKQFNELTRFDTIILHQELQDKDAYRDYRERIASDENISEYVTGSIQTVEVPIEDGVDQKANLIIPEKTEDLSRLVTLRNRHTGEHLELEDGKIILTEKLAELLEVEPGDMLYFEDDQGEPFEIEISGITETYSNHYLYMTRDTFEDLTGQKYYSDMDLIQINPNFKGDVDDLLESYIDNKAVISVLSLDEARVFMDQVTDSLNQVVAIIIVVSTLLAIVILYSLTDINIEERKLELSTIKVLGFYPIEVTSYIYRETGSLTIFGILMGFIAGRLLHLSLIKIIVPDVAMLDPTMATRNYILTGIIILFISLVVLVIIHFRLKRIDMVEALNGVE